MQDEGQVDAGELRDGGDGAGEGYMGAAGCGASRQMKWGPLPSAALASSEGLSTLAAAEDCHSVLNATIKL